MSMTTKKLKKLAPKHSPGTGLDERAMLVYLSIGFWEGRKKDEAKSSEVIKDERASEDAGTWWTRTIPPHATKPIINARLRARAVHLEYTMPWMDDGFRILPASMFLKYTEAMRQGQDNFNTVVADFLMEYPQIVKDASARLGGLFKPEMFPSQDDLANKYPWQLRFIPLPTAGDFRVNLGIEAADDIRKNIQAQVDEAMAGAMRDLWERLHEGVSKIAEKLNDSEAVFRDSLIGNVVELCELLPQMNITGDKKLEAARQDVIKKLTKQEPEVLRKNKTARADTAKAAGDILKQMESFRPKK